MKKLILIFITLIMSDIAFSQNSKHYFTGRIYSNFNWSIVDKSNSIGQVKNPLESIHTLNLSYGYKLSQKVRIETGFVASYFNIQSEFYSIVSRHYELAPSIKIGFADSLVLGTSYFVAPYFSYVIGKGNISSNGFDSENNTNGVIYGLQLSINKRIYKKLGIQPGLLTQFEKYNSYREVVGGGVKRKNEFVKILPVLNLIYNF